MSLIYNATFDKNTRKLSFEDKAGNEIYSCTVPERTPMVDDVTKPLTFRATKDGSIVRLEQIRSPDGSFQTSRDGGNTWTDYRIGDRIALNTGDEVSFRVKEDRSPYQYANSYWYFVMAGKIEAWHNVMSMYRANDFATYDTAVGSLFYSLFKDCASLTKAPVLPATTLANDTCYSYMFSGCRSLTKAPELPATTLAPNCYGHMFSGCQSLTKAPVLPATTLSFNCYYGMFSGCQSLTEAPELPATTLYSSCYSRMFEGCQSLTEAPELPATTLKDSCYMRMFWKCYSLTKSPKLTATTLANSCYAGMFESCSRLKEVYCYMPPTISTENIPTYTAEGGGGTYPWLTNVSSTGTFYTNADANWPSGESGIPTSWTRVAVDDITKPLTFKATQGGSTVTLKKNGSPTGDFQTSTDGGSTWTDYTPGTAVTINTGGEVSFRAKADRTTGQTVQDYFYFEMTGKIEAWNNVMSMYRTSDFATYKSAVDYAFTHLFIMCESLTKAPALPATTLADSCYWNTFIGCQSLIEAPELPATALAEYCYCGMFEGCRSLVKAPELPATTLASRCYYRMFSGCQSLKEVRIAATTTATDALKEWLERVYSTGDFYCDPNATIFPSGISGIPENWTRHALADYPN